MENSRPQSSEMTPSALPTIIYIASASRSGSTVVDQVLGGMRGIVSVGELRRIRDFAIQNLQVIRDPVNRRGCTCGSEVVDCVFWKAVGKDAGVSFVNDDLVSRMGAFDRALFKSLFLIFGPGFVKGLSAVYPPFKREIAVAGNFMKIYSAVAAVSGAQCVVDSSKTTQHFLALKVAYPQQMKLLALHRDGRAVSKSMIRGNRIRIFKRGRFAGDPRAAHREAAKHWIKSVLQLLPVYVRLPRKDKYFLRYEDFCAEAQVHAWRILDRFGVPHDDILSAVDKESHNIGGSPSRFSFRETGIGLDDAWRSEWTGVDAKNFGILGSMVNKLLGYD